MQVCELLQKVAASEHVEGGQRGSGSHATGLQVCVTGSQAQPGPPRRPHCRLPCFVGLHRPPHPPGSAAAYDVSTGAR
jgi:hypothetical protein